MDFQRQVFSLGRGPGVELQAEGLTTRTVPIPPPQRWISAVTFLAPVDQI